MFFEQKLIAKYWCVTRITISILLITVSLILKTKQKYPSIIVFFVFYSLLLMVIFSKDLDNNYVFCGGALLALTYKVIDIMNIDTKIAFYKKTTYIDKLIDIKFELEKNGPPCE